MLNEITNSSQTDVTYSYNNICTIYNILYDFFNVDAIVCQGNGQFQVWELNIWQFIVIVEIKYFLNLNSIVMTPTIVLCECIVQRRYLFFVKLCFDNIMSIIMTVSYMKSYNCSY
jgi:hypothetical protein